MKTTARAPTRCSVSGCCANWVAQIGRRSKRGRRLPRTKFFRDCLRSSPRLRNGSKLRRRLLRKPRRGMRRGAYFERRRLTWQCSRKISRSAWNCEARRSFWQKPAGSLAARTIWRRSSMSGCATSFPQRKLDCFVFLRRRRRRGSRWSYWPPALQNVGTRWMGILRDIEMAGGDKTRERALAATGDELTALLHDADADVLLALLDNPSLEEMQLCMLLERKNLPAVVLEEVARRKPLLKNYRVKRALA